MRVFSNFSNFSTQAGVRIRPLARGAVLLFPLLTACQASLSSRRDVTPSWGVEAVRGGGRAFGSRLRLENYDLDDFRGSAATRRWPLHEGQTRSHRFAFVVRDGAASRRDVGCVLLATRGDADRAATRLECTMGTDGDAENGKWTLRLVSRLELQEGTLHGGIERYEVRGAARNERPRPGSRASVTYDVLRDGQVVATVRLDSGRAVWIDPQLGGREREVVAAAVFAIVVGHELEAGP